MRFARPVTLAVGPVVGGVVVVHRPAGSAQRVGGRQHCGGGRDVGLGLAGNITANIVLIIILYGLKYTHHIFHLKL